MWDGGFLPGGLAVVKKIPTRLAWNPLTYRFNVLTYGSFWECRVNRDGCRPGDGPTSSKGKVFVSPFTAAIACGRGSPSVAFQLGILQGRAFGGGCLTPNAGACGQFVLLCNKCAALMVCAHNEQGDCRLEAHREGAHAL